MGLYAELPADINSVNVIIAGGGTAGCIVAARLAEKDPSLSILVLEAGPNGAGNPTVDYPALFLANMAPTTTTAAFFKSNKSSSLGDREIIVPTGNVLGGGSAINMMQYSHAQRSDWDSWKIPGWSADEVMPFIKNLESYHGPGSMDRHGTDGPIEVSTGTYNSPRLQDQFVSALGELGWPEIDDLSSMDACNGVQRSVRFVSRDGKRQDTASRYLAPCLQDGKHPNLHVVCDAPVVKVLTENKKAVGVVFKPKAEGGTAERTVKANKQVIVSAGAFGTPAILERSGIGHADVLKRAGIEQVADVPGVGNEYEDHNLMLYPFKADLEPGETMDAVLAGRMDVGKLIQENHGILGWNAQEATAKLRPNDKDVASFAPELKDLWDEEYKNDENKPLMMMALVCTFPGEPTGIPPGEYFAISVFTVYPLSRGHLHITGPGLNDPVDFNTGFFSDAKGVDVKKHRWAYKKQREIARRMPVFRDEFAPGHPAFAVDSKAASVDLSSEPSAEIRDIEYTAEDDALIDEWVRNKVGSAWHSLGTCKMGPIEKNGVVDHNLSVYGVEGLKLADLSGVPSNVAANTNFTAMVVGEKAADIVIKELGF
ncbi:unnamed protein product [Clonostachys rosea f. rosea IK726]|uniref:Uncharacterized protein n=1 Tax=Clonostachys rosea f. rosea IK726 TaxID=1349383 RepID=A0ACA9U771_BIOOC|nr:unnamed protein product [Clonostachys rosea f. rosea IK726]